MSVAAVEIVFGLWSPQTHSKASKSQCCQRVLRLVEDLSATIELGLRTQIPNLSQKKLLEGLH